MAPQGDKIVMDSKNKSTTTNSNNTTHTSSGVPLVELSLQNITYAPVAKGSHGRARTTVLHQVSTTIRPYTLTAWMGPSGSGKTSLLSVAADLIKSNDILQTNNNGNGDSCILVNGEEGRIPKRLVGVVWQDDLLLHNLTVQENVWYTARLKTSPHDAENGSDAAVATVVDDTLRDLGLWHVRDSIVGNPLAANGQASSRGISGGERKRVAVANELVVQPSLLLLDEPTSGLDATTAAALMQTLRQLAARGHSIAAVIHQPRTTIFQSLDHLLLLSKGHVVYDGPPRGVRNYLEACPTVTPLPPETGIADWLMDVIVDDEKQVTAAMAAATTAASGGGDNDSDDEKKKGGAAEPTQQIQQRPPGPLAKYWKEHGVNYKANLVTASDAENNNQQTRDTATASSPDPSQQHEPPPTLQRKNSLRELESLPKYNVPFTMQLRLLTKRTFLQQRGERLTTTAGILQLAYLFFTALFWWQIPDNTNGIFERNSLLFFMLIAQANGIVISAVTVFQRERTLLGRERAKKLYAVSAYFLGKTASDMTNNVLLPVLYCLVVYWTAGYRRDAAAYFRFALAFYLTLSTAQSMGLMMSVAIPSMTLALVLAPPITLFFMIMGGFYIPLDNLHAGVEWLSWLSFARYGYSALVVNEYEGRFIPCSDDEVSIAIGTSTGECPLPGEAVLDSLGIRGINDNYWFNIGMVVLLQVVFRVTAYILLRRSK